MESVYYQAAPHLPFDAPPEDLVKWARDDYPERVRLDLPSHLQSKRT